MKRSALTPFTLTCQPSFARTGGILISTKTTAFFLLGLTISKTRSASDSASIRIVPETGATFRCAMLLSYGTSRQCGMEPETVPPTASTTLLSPAALTIISRHSWPTVVGVHSNAPTCMVPPLTSGPGDGDQRRRHRRPVRGPDQAGHRAAVVAADVDRGGGARAAVLDADVGEVRLPDDRLLVRRAAVGARRFQMSVVSQKFSRNWYSPLRPSSMYTSIGAAARRGAMIGVGVPGALVEALLLERPPDHLVHRAAGEALEARRQYDPPSSARRRSCPAAASA